jgi:peptidoglycan/LPS O-acetylase OafA/YrhL
LSDIEQRQNNFNILRLALASLVILSHAPELHEGGRESELLTRVFHTLSFGELAVDGFFLLSGYLITQSWDRQPRWWPFLKKRLLRIYPAFIVASVLCACVLGPWVAANATYASEFSIWRFLRAMLTLGAPDIPPVFPGRPHPAINGAMWTIEWEFRCYLAVLAVGCLRFVSFRHAWTLLTLVVFSVWTMGRLTTDTAMQAWITGYLPSLWRLGSFFLVGGCFYSYRERVALTGRAATLSLAVLLPCMFSVQLCEPALALLGGYLLFYAAQVPAPALRSFNSGADISYGVYLYGWPVQNLVSSLWPQANVWLLLPLVYLVCVALAVMSWYVVERPFLQLKRVNWRGGGRVRKLS